MKEQSLNPFDHGTLSEPFGGPSRLLEECRALNPLLEWGDGGGGEIESERFVFVGLYAAQPGSRFDYFGLPKPRKGIIEARRAFYEDPDAQAEDWGAPSGHWNVYVCQDAGTYSARLMEGDGVRMEKRLEGKGTSAKEAVADLWGIVHLLAHAYSERAEVLGTPGRSSVSYEETGICAETLAFERSEWRGVVVELEYTYSENIPEPFRLGAFVVREERSPSVLRSSEPLQVFLTEVFDDTLDGAVDLFWNRVLSFVACWEQWDGFLRSYPILLERGDITPFGAK